MRTLKTLMVFGMFMCFTFFSRNVNAQSINENALIGQAQGELAQCMAGALQLQLDIFGEVTGSCPGGGYTVTLFGISRCPQDPRIQCKPLLITVGSVQFDCNGNIVGSTCEPLPF